MIFYLEELIKVIMGLELGLGSTTTDISLPIVKTAMAHVAFGRSGTMIPGFTSGNTTIMATGTAPGWYVGV